MRLKVFEWPCEAIVNTADLEAVDVLSAALTVTALPEPAATDAGNDSQPFASAGLTDNVHSAELVTLNVNAGAFVATKLWLSPPVTDHWKAAWVNGTCLLCSAVESVI